ncbi:hypothetical protein ACSCBZ_46260 [Streptomyces niveiscabiei]|uniref:hypothetical protein n=1 Tax=Streptomyces niveiscabiei TaxID=164115 RepID=UPI0006EBD026|nr:hypothetical protein [Streptomyces niveiscabiei]
MTITDPTTAALYAQALQATIDDPGRCVVPWGVCPEHGGTLKSSGNRTWCMDFTCFNSWEYDRLDAPCPEPATHTVRSDSGGQYAVCDGHAMTARLQITGGQVLPGTPA